MALREHFSAYYRNSLKRDPESGGIIFPIMFLLLIMFFRFAVNTEFIISMIIRKGSAAAALYIPITFFHFIVLFINIDWCIQVVLFNHIQPYSRVFLTGRTKKGKIIFAGNTAQFLSPLTFVYALFIIPVLLFAFFIPNTLFSIISLFLIIMIIMLIVRISGTLVQCLSFLRQFTILIPLIITVPLIYLNFSPLMSEGGPSLVTAMGIVSIKDSGIKEVLDFILSIPGFRNLSGSGQVYVFDIFIQIVSISGLCILFYRLQSSEKITIGKSRSKIRIPGVLFSLLIVVYFIFSAEQSDSLLKFSSFISISVITVIHNSKVFTLFKQEKKGLLRILHSKQALRNIILKKHSNFLFNSSPILIILIYTFIKDTEFAVYLSIISVEMLVLYLSTGNIFFMLSPNKNKFAVFAVFISLLIMFISGSDFNNNLLIHISLTVLSLIVYIFQLKRIEIYGRNELVSRMF